MSSLATQLSLEDDLPAVRQLVADHGAELGAGDEPGVFWLTMHPTTAPHETFHARIAWTSYPDAPPSIKFADAIDGRLDVTSAWPIIPGYRPASYDICQPFTAEAYLVHPEWATGPEAWPSDGNPFEWVVGRLLHDMCDRYQGRSG
jgi:hypothetical protein